MQSTSRRRLPTSPACAAATLALSLMACAPEATPADEGTTLEALSVDSRIGAGCSTTVVRGLVEQLVAEVNCLEPGAFSDIRGIPNVSLSTAAAAAPYLQRDAAQALDRAARSRSGTLSINSGLRTLPQQYLLYQWRRRGLCSIRAAARPGRSNHESGLAVDVSSSSRGTFSSALRAEGFSWAGSGDPPHFDFHGGEDLRSRSVLAFQRLWNRNHPEDEITEDGIYGGETESRLRRSPAEGFARGASCGPADDPGDTGDEPMEPPVASDAGAPPPPPPPPAMDAGTSDPPPPPPPSDPCAGRTSCEHCNEIYECGFCSGTGTCMRGDGSGPASGSCASGWQWVEPSSCGATDPDPDPGPDPDPVCEPVRGSCSTDAVCCSGLDCRRGVSFGVRCCAAAGTSCASGGDCCGYMDCVSGACACRGAGRACLDGGDCCSGRCSSGRCS